MMNKLCLKTIFLFVVTFITLGFLLVRLQKNTVMHSRREVDNLLFVVNKLNALCSDIDRNTSICRSVKDITKASSKKRLYLQARSRLGNNIFQYVVLYVLAHRTERVPVLIHGSAKDFLYMFNSISVPVIDEIPPDVENVQETYPGTYDEEVIKSIMKSERDVEICCHFESFKYFLPEYSDQIRKELVIRESLKKEMDLYLHNLTENYYQRQVLTEKPSKLTYVGVHIRRGDMAWIINGFNLPPASYFHRAMAYYRQKYGPVIFVVVSQEKDWTLANVKASDVVYSMKDRSYEDLTLLALCNHTIGSIGTFTWWGGWLAGGEMIYFRDCFIPGSETALKRKSADLFPEHWIPMV